MDAPQTTENERNLSMGLGELIIFGLALAMDSFAVTISNSFTYHSEPLRRMFLMPVFFGLFQGMMPVFGYLLGELVADILETYAGIVTLVILGFIGISMIREGIVGEDEGGGPAAHLTLGIILLQAVATAIDAFAVGVSLVALDVNIALAAFVIAVTTFLVCLVALFIGQKVGQRLGNRAQILGGVVLLVIGIRAFFS